MAFSDDDNEILNRMEQDLLNDAEFSERLREFGDHAEPAKPASEAAARNQNKIELSWSPRKAALGGLLVLIGLAVLLTGVTIGYSVLGIVTGVVGVLLMFGGIYVVINSAIGGKEHAGKRDKGSEPSGGSFGERQRKAFDKRRRN
ncbi:DUF3040 domain-containing protein [Boudabousia marimammalium]|uniref:DUF3040 domain-containing protein n=1 Tax=Boudabousia marimammalium TaxID=156892 RepID=A0A1Q5PP13_9ACTO|nr:DUF3040 domain-containing protein [Boudabousia marimammalium]OKL49249.1 hypothetical protein BM477_04480 [Boudabousia marimammalium]